MDEAPILVERRAGYRVLTLNRPERLNAFNEPMHHALAAVIAEAEQDESCRALLLTGAGCNIALACDIVLAARSTNFVQSFARIGLNPDSGGTWLLPRLVGQARARGLVLLAEPLPAEKAEAWGLIWKAVDDDALTTEAEKLCAHFASAPSVGLGLIKRALDAAANNDLATQLDLERDLQREASLTPDYAEGVRAFMEKRKPVFTGRR